MRCAEKGGVLWARSRTFVFGPGVASSPGTPRRHLTTRLKRVALYATLPVPFLRNREKCSVRVPEKGKGEIEMQSPTTW